LGGKQPWIENVPEVIKVVKVLTKLQTSLRRLGGLYQSNNVLKKFQMSFSWSFKIFNISLWGAGDTVEF